MNTRTLGEICNVVSGGTPSRTKPEYWNGGNIPWIKIGNLKNKLVNDADEYITQAGLDNSSAKMLTKGTILYSIFATLGEVGILTFDACTNQAIAGITIKNQSEVLTDYLYYYLKSKKEYVNDIGRGVAQNNINMTILRGFEVPLPDIADQYQTVSVLDKTANIIDIQKQELQKLDELVKARFVELFGDPELITQSEHTISEIADVQVGIVIKPTRFYSDNNDGIKAFRSLNIAPMEIKDENWVYFTEAAMKENQRTIVHTGDVLIVRSGNPGTSCMVTPEYDGCNVIDLIIAHPKKELVYPEFLCAFTNMPHGKNQIDSQQHGVAQKHFNVGMYNNLKVIIPTKEKQEEFIEFLHQVDKVKFAVQESLNKTQLLFDSLMQQYFG